MSAQPTIPFQVLDISLDKKNLIEASAGTGKTYSIALLALRLLLEIPPGKSKPLSIDQILMVTFTKYAVAELQTRIRMFIRTALHICESGATSEEKDIVTIVERAKKKFGTEETIQLLKQAVVMMDETAIMTIHSFCQQILTEYAFDTEQTFGTKAISGGDYDLVIQHSVHRFWRNHITTLSVPVVERLKSFLSIGTLVDMSQKTIGGKKLWLRAPIDDVLSDLQQEKFVSDCLAVESVIEKHHQEAIEYLQSNVVQLKELCMNNTYAKKWIIDQPQLFEEPEMLLEKVIEESSKQYVQKIFAELFTIYQLIQDLEKDKKNIIGLYYNRLMQYALHEITGDVARQKEENGWISFDDMIAKVRDAVMVNDNLCHLIRNKYHAVFIDEFQDTDSIQYEIFHRLFHLNTTLYYIGDPKQSIYGFRKADMNTYFKAKNEGVDRVLAMNTNYRSSASMIEALNLFYKPSPDFDTFHFEGSADSIEYIQVHTPTTAENHFFQYNGKSVPSLSIIDDLQNKDEIQRATAAQVAELLRDDYEICIDGKPTKLQPADIGILVGTKYEARAIKNRLSAFKIPAVTLEDDKVLETEQARELYYVLHAVVTMEKDKIQKALLTELAGFTVRDLSLLQMEIVIERFKTYQHTLFATEKGIYVMMTRFANDHQLRERMLHPDTKNGERKLSNWIQLLELLNGVENKKQWTPHELLSWLGKIADGKKIEGDEYVQRIDSDENAVKIITVHKSKGLEYKVVLAPNLDLNTTTPNHIKTEDFRSETDGQYYFDQKGLLTEDCEAWRIKQSEQENRRLIYVALTRAKYKCYVFANYREKEKSSLRKFLSVLSENKTPSINNFVSWEKPSTLNPSIFKYRSNAAVVLPNYRKADDFSLLETGWKKLSYSALNPPHTIAVSTALPVLQVSAYDSFIFEQLKKGAKTGNLLHYIFEQADFTDSTYWPKIIQYAAKRVGTTLTDEMMEGLMQMMHHVCTVDLPGGLKLNTVGNDKKLNELEFDFPISLIHRKQLEALSPTATPWQIQSDDTLQGLMNGKMDLFFESEGKYYLLDWKSNHLGYQTDDYTDDRVAEAMTANNYHLQYHLYTVALYKYLQLRLPGFDYDKHFGGVIYLFVRGIRIGENNGIFYHQPERRLIEGMLHVFDS